MTQLHKYNTFEKRFLAGIIDGLVFLPFSIVNNRFEHADNRTLLICWTVLYTICWTLYVVIGHGIYGQTIGKRLMNIKVFDIHEQHVIGYKRAFFREAVLFFAHVIGIIYFTIAIDNTSTGHQDLNNTYFEGYVRLSISIWFVVELITMFLNKKRRALHDFIAGSVVIDLNEMKREDLQRRHQNLLKSI